MSRFTGRRLPRRIVQLLIGLFLYGIGIAFMVRGAIGAAPWDVLTQGISNHSSLTFGTITIITGAVVLLLWIPLRQRPGVGTILNAIFIGVFADFGLALYPASEELCAKILFYIIFLSSSA